MGTISFKQFQALEAVARNGSFTRAARELGVSQPTVSNLVYALEKHYNCRLLERSSAEVTTTALFDRLKGNIRAIITLGNSIDDTLTKGKELVSGQIRIAYSTFQLAMPLISGFTARFPLLELDVQCLASHEMLLKLERGEFDIGFINSVKEPVGFAALKIADTRIGLVVPDAHPLANSGPVDWDTVSQLSLLQRVVNSGIRRGFEHAAQAAQVQFHQMISAGPWGSMINLIHSGRGIGIGLEHECADEPGITFVEIADPALVAGHYLVCPLAMRDTAIVSEFYKSAADSLVA